MSKNLELKELLINHLGDLNSNNSPWEIKNTIERGRGIFATRDILVNEIIFRDFPIIIGPRFGKNEIICVVCFKVLKSFTNQICKIGCNLPLCDFCQNSKSHKRECELICTWQPASSKKISLITYNSLTFIRGLLLNDKSKKLLELLKGDIGAIPNIKTEMLAKEFKNFPNDENIYNLLKFTLSVIKTNAFETMLEPDNGYVESVIGLYPLASISNHGCIPNIRYTFDAKHIMTVKAIRSIKKDEEIFNSYTKPFLSTPLRRILLKETKNFLCTCARCSDPTEKQTFLTAIKCIDENCSGIMLPIDSLSITSNWKCLRCQKEHLSKRIFALQKIISELLTQVMQKKNLNDVIKFINEKLKFCLPETNQLVIEMKLHAIWKIGRKSENNNKDFELNEFLEKEKYCLEAIHILKKLHLEESIKAGFIYYELYKCRCEINKFNGNHVVDHENKKLFQRSLNILGDSVVAPPELRAFGTNHDLKIVT